jgi:hypothetical protein
MGSWKKMWTTQARKRSPEGYELGNTFSELPSELRGGNPETGNQSKETCQNQVKRR